MISFFNNLVHNIQLLVSEEQIDPKTADAMIGILYVAMVLPRIKGCASYLPRAEFEILLECMQLLPTGSPLLPRAVNTLIALVDTLIQRDETNKVNHLQRVALVAEKFDQFAFSLLRLQEESETLVYLSAHSKTCALHLEEAKKIHTLQEIVDLINSKIREPFYQDSGNGWVPTLESTSCIESIVQETAAALKQKILNFSNKPGEFDSVLKMVFQSYGGETDLQIKQVIIDNELLGKIIRTLFNIVPKKDKVLYIRIALQTYKITYDSADYVKGEEIQQKRLSGIPVLFQALDRELPRGQIIKLLKHGSFDLMSSDDDVCYQAYLILKRVMQGEEIELAREDQQLGLITLLHSPEGLLDILNLATSKAIRLGPDLLKSDIPFLFQQSWKKSDGEFVAKFLDFWKHVKDINQKAGPFQQRNPWLLMVRHAPKIHMLASILNVAGIEYMYQHVANTLLPLEKILDFLPFLHHSHFDWLAEYFSNHMRTKKDFETIKNILISIGLILDNNPEFFEQYYEKPLARLPVPSVFLNQIIQGILQSLFLNRDIALTDAEFEALIPRLSGRINLIAASQKMRNAAYKEVYLELLLRDLTGGDIAGFLRDLDQANAVGRNLAHHNSNISHILEYAGIIANDALHYTPVEQLILFPESESAKGEKSNHYLVLWQYLQQLHEQMQSTKTKGLGSSFIQKLDKSIKSIDQLRANIVKKTQQGHTLSEAASAVLSENLSSLVGKNILKNCLSLREERGLPAGFKEFVEHTRVQFELVSKRPVKTPKNEAKNKVSYFSVRQWDKSHPETFLLGERVGCCLSPANAQFPAMVQRRMDDAMLFHVVIDESSKQVVALLWLGLVKTPDCIALVLNFVETKAKFAQDSYTRKALLNMMLAFTQRYLEANPAIEKLFMRPLPYGWNMGDLDAYPITDLKIIDKVGGAFIPEAMLEELYNEDPNWQDHASALTPKLYYFDSLKENRFHVFGPEQLKAEYTQQVVPLWALIQNTVIALVKKRITFDECVQEVLSKHQEKLSYFYKDPHKNADFLTRLFTEFEQAAIKFETDNQYASFHELTRASQAFFKRLNVVVSKEGALANEQQSHPVLC